MGGEAIIVVDVSKMRTVSMGLLKRGARTAEWDARPAELAELQEKHLANNARLAIELHPWTIEKDRICGTE